MSRRVRAGEIELNVVERGSGSPILFAHGFPLDHSMWNEQLDGLADVGRLIAPDLRGFGGSDVSGDVVTMEEYADDLAALLDSLDVTEPVTFCGLSMGGYIAWQFWRRHPGRLGRLILCDTRAVADTAEAARVRWESAEHVLARGPAFLIETMMPRLFAPATLRDRPAMGESMRTVIRNAPRVGVAAALRGMAGRPDVTAELGSIDVPTLVLCGSEDAISPVAEMRAIAAAMPNARFVEIAHAGHMTPLEAPAAVNQAIREFLRPT